MIWFWSREDEKLRLEMRYDSDLSEFVVVVEHPDGRRGTERFDNMDAFRARLVELEESLEAQDWKQSGIPQLVPEWFPRRPLGRQPALEGATNDVPNVARRVYAAGPRVFELTLSRTDVKGQSLWTIESVTESSAGREPVIVPGVFDVMESAEDAAFARACDRIDKWLFSRH
jgi:hypothetical protein